MNYIVYYVNDIDESKVFFESLGLEFEHEKHGNGPVHYSTKINGVVFEVYPCLIGKAPTVTRFGLAVSETAPVVKKLISSGATGGSVVTDPNGNKIDLTW